MEFWRIIYWDFIHLPIYWEISKWEIINLLSVMLNANYLLFPI